VNHCMNTSSPNDDEKKAIREGDDYTGGVIYPRIGIGHNYPRVKQYLI
jgi:hypothetical protein